MKKLFIPLALSASVLFSGCYGSYTLTNKLHKWIGTTGEEPIPTIVTWVGSVTIILPAALILDFVVLNAAEYWLGSNPLAMDEGISESQIVTAKDGKQYRIEATKNKFEIYALTQVESQTQEELVMEMFYSEIDRNWTMRSKSGTEVVTRVNPLGQVEILNINEAG